MEPQSRAIRVGAKSAMPPRLSKQSESTTVRVVVSRDFLKRLEAWRREQPGLPSTSESIRRMCEQVLSRWEKGKPK